MSSFKGNPQIEITEIKKDRVCFVLRNADVSVANALRRVMISEVPTLAIDLVTIYENHSVLHDEFISHRLGLLPICSSRIREYKYKEECECTDRCSNCSAEFSLDVMCSQDQPVTVTHADLLPSSQDPSYPMPVPRHEEMRKSGIKEGITIVKLKKNQTLKLEAIATKGTGKLHAKWIPCATAVFQYEPDVQINEKLLESVPSSVQQEIAACCPRHVFSLEGDTFTLPVLSVVNRSACIFCDECISTAKESGYPNLVSVGQQPDVFRFVVESTGAMPAEQIVEMALEVLEDKLATMMKCVSKLEGFKEQHLADSSSYAAGGRQGKRGRPGASWEDSFALDMS